MTVATRATWSSTIFSFFFNDTATTEIYTLSLHDALPISVLTLTRAGYLAQCPNVGRLLQNLQFTTAGERDRKSTRLNSSHSQISYAVFCLKKKTGTSCAQLHDREFI